MNYYSNAVKYMAEGGKILILVQLIKGHKSTGQNPNASANAIAEFQESVRKHYEEKFEEDSDSDYDVHLSPNKKEKKNKRRPSDPGITSFAKKEIKLGQVEKSHSLFEQAAEDKVIISVMDQGLGIKTKNQHKLFQLFGKISDNQKLNTKGVGLGLVISQMIANEFGGGVSVQSKYSVGSIFQASFLSTKFENSGVLTTLNEAKLAEQIKRINDT